MKGPQGNVKKEPQILGGIQRRSSEEETEWWREPQKLRASKLASTMTVSWAQGQCTAAVCVQAEGVLMWCIRRDLRYSSPTIRRWLPLKG